MLQRRDLVPHFAVMKLDGSHASYHEIWQRKNLLLVLLPVEESAERADYVSQLEGRAQDFTVHETECVITADAVLDLPRPGVLIADRWGETLRWLLSAERHFSIRGGCVEWQQSL
jgi:hypothetical protein